MKEAVSIPVVVNGDITDSMMPTPRCSLPAPMPSWSGRGAQGRPWLPGQLARYLAGGKRRRRLLARPDIDDDRRALRGDARASRSLPSDCVTPASIWAGRSMSSRDRRRAGRCAQHVRQRGAHRHRTRAWCGAASRWPLMPSERRTGVEERGMSMCRSDRDRSACGCGAQCSAASGHPRRFGRQRCRRQCRLRRPSSKSPCRCCAATRCTIWCRSAVRCWRWSIRCGTAGAAVNEYKVDLGTPRNPRRPAGRSLRRAAVPSSPTTWW